TAIKRGKLNVYPHFWDIPGGSVEPGETPQEGARREAVEEIGLEISLEKIIHEDGEYDAAKATVFTRLVYAAVPNQ
ncbi:MAG: NUDIX domain-containing protein, partial [Lactococcus raffinolactis]